MSLIVLAPTVLTMWSTSCKMKTARSSDAIFKNLQVVQNERKEVLGVRSATFSKLLNIEIRWSARMPPLRCCHRGASCFLRCSQQLVGFNTNFARFLLSRMVVLA
jgi:hypothetical protein